LYGAINRLVLARRAAIFTYYFRFLVLYGFLVKVPTGTNSLEKKSFDICASLKVMPHLDVIIIEIFDIFLNVSTF
jgi:hypothetical protein